MARTSWALVLLGVFSVMQGLNVVDSSYLPAKPCPPVCAIACKYGNVLDVNGCPTCRCKDPPAPVCPRRKCSPCPNGYIYENGCQTCRCKPACRPAVCPTIKCAYGLKRDANGCEICKCNPFPVCSKIGCAKDCPNGYIIQNGCPLCECKPDVCQDRCPHYCANPAAYPLPPGCNCRCPRLPPIY